MRKSREIGPAVAPAQVAARHAGRRRAWSSARPVVARDQRAPGGLADVVVAGVRQRRVEQRVELVGAPGERLEPDVDEDRRAARVGHVGLGDPPAPGARRVDLAVGEAARVGEPGRVPGVLALALGERPAVSHHELEVADAGRAEVGRVDLGQRAVVERQPGLARRARSAVPMPSLSPSVQVATSPGAPGASAARAAPGRASSANAQTASKRRNENPTAPRVPPLPHVNR